MDTPAVAPVAATSPIAAAPAAPMTPPSVNTNPTASNGATTPDSSGSFTDSFKKAISNPVQIGFGILFATAGFYFIYWLQYSNKFNKTFVKNVENKIDELDIKYADVLSKMNKQAQTATQNDLNLF
jgi:hypothetical protein